MNPIGETFLVNLYLADPTSENVVVSRDLASKLLGSLILVTSPARGCSIIRRVFQMDELLPTESIRVPEVAAFRSPQRWSSARVSIIDPSIIPPLSKIYVAVPSAMYLILHNWDSDKVRRKFIEEWTAQAGGIVNSDDYINPINGTVQLCEPLPRGKVTLDTAIVFVSVSPETFAASALQETLTDTKNNYYPQAEEVNPSDLSEHESSNIEADASNSCDLTKYLEFSLNLAPVSVAPQAHFSVRPLPFAPSYIDRNEAIICVSTTEISRVGLAVFDGDLLLLKSPHSETVVRLRAAPDSLPVLPVHSIYVSSIAMINCKLNSGDVVSCEPLPDIAAASQVSIARVVSKVTLTKAFESTLISTLRRDLEKNCAILKSGDYIPVLIDTSWTRTLHEYSPDIGSANALQSTSCDSIAWYKVISTKGHGGPHFRIDPKITALTLAQVDYARPPANKLSRWYQYYQLPPLFQYTSAFEYATELRKILVTLTKTEARFATTIMLTSASRGAGKIELINSLAIDLGLTLVEIECIDLINPSQELKTLATLQAQIDQVVSDTPQNAQCFYVLVLKHVDALCPHVDDNDQNSSIHESLSMKVVSTLDSYLKTYPNMCAIITTNNPDKVSRHLKSLAQFTIKIGVPSEPQRQDIFLHLLVSEKGNGPMRWSERKDVSVSLLAQQSAGLSPRDLISIIHKAQRLALRRMQALAREFGISIDNLVQVSGGTCECIPQDFSDAINDARNQYSDSIGAPRIPNVSWQDIGGLDIVKGEILDTIDMPLKHPELFSNGLKKRSGILFYGPPGTGKTLLAKAIATNFSLNFFSVKGPELLNMYIGESEANVRRVFERARDAKPCVIFFDELDSVAPKRGNQGDSGGVMDRIVSQLLAELDGMSGGDGDGVFVVGATNRPDLLDEALLRPGRFDKMLYLGISDLDAQQAKILLALTRKFHLHEDVDLEMVAAQCPFTFTGADFYALCSDAMLNAMTRTAHSVDRLVEMYNATRDTPVSTRWWFDNVCVPSDIQVLVKMQDFTKARLALNPSVSEEELKHYLKVRENFEGVNKE